MWNRSIYSEYSQSRSTVLQESIVLLFSIQKDFYYLELHKVRDEDDAITRNITAQPNDHIYLCHIRTSY